MLIVNDGSTDSTESVLAELQSRYPNVDAKHLGRNLGKAAALKLGFAAALAEGADIVVMMDADGQDDPAELSRLVAELGEGAALVTGARVQRNDRFIKRHTSRLYNWTTGKLSGAPGRDFNSGFKAMTSDVAAAVSPMLYGELHRYLTVMAYWSGIQGRRGARKHHARMHGRSKYGLARFWRGFMDLMTVRFLMSYEHRPSHLFGGFGLRNPAARRRSPRVPVRPVAAGGVDR